MDHRWHLASLPLVTPTARRLARACSTADAPARKEGPRLSCIGTLSRTAITLLLCAPLACGSSDGSPDGPAANAGSGGTSATGGTAGTGGTGGAGQAGAAGKAGAGATGGSAGTGGGTAGASTGGQSGTGGGASGTGGGTAGTGGACGTAPHTPCQTGVALDPMCDPCAAIVCGTDPYCCKDTWDLTCAESAYVNCQTACPGGSLEGAGPLPASNVKIAKIKVTFYGSCGLDTTGQLWCWGVEEDDNMFLDGGVGVFTYFPRRVKGATNLVDFAIGAHAICTVDTSHQLVCWGHSETAAITPTPTMLATDVAEIALNDIGFWPGCIRKTDGTVWCLGNTTGGSGPAGTGDATVTTFTQVPMVSNAVALADGEGYNACAILSDGTVRCWGYGGVQTGNWNPSKATPVNCLPSMWNATAGTDCASPLTNVTSVAVAGHTCVVSNGAVKCIGSDAHGELDGIMTNVPGALLSPALPGPAVSVGVSDYSEDSGSGNSCALLASGDVYCWGWDSHGSTGTNGLSGQGSVVAPTKVPGLPHIVSFVRQDSACMAIADDGTVYAWGHDDGNYRLGVGAPTPATNPVPVSPVPFVTTP